MVEVLEAGTTQATFSGSVVNTDGANGSGTFSSAIVLAITARIEIDPADIGSMENISITEQLTQTASEFAIYVAYDTNDGVLRYNSAPIQYSVN